MFSVVRCWASSLSLRLVVSVGSGSAVSEASVEPGVTLASGADMSLASAHCSRPGSGLSVGVV